MSKLKLGPIADDKPLKVQVELPAALHQDLVDYAQFQNEKGNALTIEIFCPVIALMLHRQMCIAAARTTNNSTSTWMLW